MTGIVALYIFMLAAFTGYEVIARVPVILHTPLMSGSNFVHGIVVVGAMFALLNATSVLEQAIGFFGVLLGAGNAARRVQARVAGVDEQRRLRLLQHHGPHANTSATWTGAPLADARC